MFPIPVNAGGISTTSPNMVLNFASGTLDPRVTFTRTQATYGNVTYTGSNGLIQYASVNLLTYSQDLTQNAYWGPANVTITGNATASPNGTNTASMVSLANGTLTKYVYQSVTSSTQSSLSIYAKANTQLYLQIIATSDNQAYANFDLSSGTVGSFGSKTTASITSVGNGWYRCVASFNSTVTAFTQIRFYGVDSSSASWASSSSGTGNFYLWGAQLEPTSSATTYIPTTAAASGAARFDYNPVTLAANGLLIEESRANLFTYSQNYTNAVWLNTGNITVNGNAATAPDGTNTFASWVESTTASVQHLIYQPTVIAAASSITMSVFAKNYGRRYFSLYPQGSAGTAYAIFDTQTGAVTATGGAQYVSSSITNFGNGVYRCSVTFTGSIGTSNAALYLTNSSTNPNATYTGDGTSGIYIWGAQLEAGAFPTSYIATTSTSITRSADNASMTGTNFSSWFNASQGTFVVNSSSASNTANGRFLTVSDGTITNQIWLLPSNGVIAWFGVYTSGAFQCQLNTTVYTNNAKGSGTYKASNFACVVNGGAASTSASGSLAASYTQMNIGANYVGGTILNGAIKSINYYPSALSASQIKGLTT